MVIAVNLDTVLHLRYLLCQIQLHFEGEFVFLLL
jgi:hypothetical protein